MVVDASVAAKWFLPGEELAEPARQLLVDHEAGLVRLAAPDYIRCEIPSAITAATLGKAPRISREHAEMAIDAFLAISIDTTPSDRLALEAFRLVHSYGCAFYDALYVALAQRLGLRLLVADHRLYRLVRQLPGVTWIGAYGIERG